MEYFEDDFVDSIYKKSLEELNTFFNLQWIKNTPPVFIMSNHLTIDKLQNRKTEGWTVGFGMNRTVFLLDRQKFSIESSHSYSDDNYKALLKHELCHLFYNKLSNDQNKPIWLSEGICIYVSGQNKFRKNKPKNFTNFLEFDETHVIGKKTVYDESGLVIEMLVNKFGKEKLFELVKETSKITNKKSLNDLFKKIYGIDLNYANINKLYA